MPCGSISSPLVEARRLRPAGTRGNEWAKGKRYFLSIARPLLHQPLIGGVLQGSATVLSIEAEEILRLRKALYGIITSRSGKPTEVLERDCDRNKWLDAKETIGYGLAHVILERMPARPG